MRYFVYIDIREFGKDFPLRLLDFEFFGAKNISAAILVQGMVLSCSKQENGVSHGKPELRKIRWLYIAHSLQ